MRGFQGNNQTSRQSVEKYLLYRSAEVTVAAGYDYFILLEEGVESQDSSYTTPGKYTSDTSADVMGMGNIATGSAETTRTYKPPQTYTSRRYIGSARIRGFKGEVPAGTPNAFDAHQVLQYLGPSIEKPK